LTPSLTSIFVNHHSEDLIRRHLSSVASAGKVIVVDNSDTAEIRDVTVLRPRRNLGFGAACNLALEHVDTDVVAFVNPDVEVTTDALSELSARVSASTGLIAPSLVLGSRVRSAGFHYPSPAREVALVSRLIKNRGRSGAAPATTNRVFHPPVVGSRAKRFGSGALVVACREDLERLGGFDRRYFLYVEDLDIWDRARRLGLPVTFAPDIEVGHHCASASPASHAWREILRWVGVELFVADRGGPWRVYRAVHSAGLAVAERWSPTLARPLRSLWDWAAEPNTVQEALRPGLESGRLGS